MNFSVTGEPAPDQLDQKRKNLLQSLMAGRPGQQRLLGGVSGRGGFTRGYTASDSPTASVPGVSFNPFLAQLQRGFSGLNQPTAGVRQGIDNATAQAGAPGAPGGMLPGDNTPPPGGGDLTSLMGGGGALSGAPQGGGYGFLDYGTHPQGTVGAPPSPTALAGFDPAILAGIFPPSAPVPIPYLRPGTRTIAG